MRYGFGMHKPNTSLCLTYRSLHMVMRELAKILREQYGMALTHYLDDWA